MRRLFLPPFPQDGFGEMFDGWFGGGSRSGKVENPDVMGGNELFQSFRGIWRRCLGNMETRAPHFFCEFLR